MTFPVYVALMMLGSVIQVILAAALLYGMYRFAKWRESKNPITRTTGTGTTHCFLVTWKMP